MKMNKIINSINKFLFTILLTVVTLIVLKSSSNLKTSFYKYVYQDNISFAQINSLYKKYFGSQIPFLSLINKDTKTVFNEQLKYQSKKEYKDGVELIVEKNYLIPAIYEGMVVYVGDKEGYGNTIIVSCTNGIDVWYSNISSNVKIYDYIEKGSLIGEAGSSNIYLAFKKNNEFVSYEDHI